MHERSLTLDELAAAVGTELGVSSWVEVDQRRIDAFAEVSGDHQWIHLDPERAADGPYGGCVAHGLLVLSLLPALAAEVFVPAGTAARINYGYDRIRFPAALPAGGAVRDRVSVLDCRLREDGRTMLRLRHHVEARGTDAPVCVADSISLLVGGVS